MCAALRRHTQQFNIVPRPQVTQDVPPLPCYTVSVDVQQPAGSGTGDAADADADAAATRRFMAIASTFGPYLEFGKDCLPAAAGSDTASNGDAAGSDSGQQPDAGAADRLPCSFTAPLVLADPADGCGGALANAGAARGAAVGVMRGGCTFATKVERRAAHNPCTAAIAE